LAAQGCRLAIANRTRERARALAELVSDHCSAAHVAVLGLDQAALPAPLAEADLLVNTTSVGMGATADAPLLVPPAALPPGLFVYDLIYSRAEPRLLAAARARGCRAANGLAMLAHQGALALEFWLGRPAPVETMERALAGALAAREG